MIYSILFLPFNINNYTQGIIRVVSKMGPCIGATSQSSSMIKNKKIKIGEHTIIIQQKLASGAYGDIWKCKDIKSNTIFAAKQIKLQTLELKQMFTKQSKWLEKLSQVPGVVTFIGSKILDDANENKEKKGKQIKTGIILTQFYEISLFDGLKNKRFKPKQVAKFLKQMTITLKGIHSLGCLHMDLKLENILCKINDEGSQNYYVCDFGSCLDCPINIPTMSKAQKSRLKEYIQSNSTLIYRPPELIDLTQPLTAKVDMWMLGCILHMLIYRKHPFQGQGQLGIMTAQVDFSRKVELELEQDKEGKDEKIVKQLIECMKGMIEVKPEKRYTEDQILNILVF